MNLFSRAREILAVFFLAAVFFPAGAGAGLTSVSGRQDANGLTGIAPAGDPAQVAVSLANGLPVWYQDANGLKLQLCLDSALEVAPGVVINPCEYEPPLANAPPSFPSNFGAEALYWSGAALGTYTSSDGLTNSALLVLALEATGALEAALTDGNQTVFNRIRIRVDVPVAGTYRVTHPFGSRDYVVTTPGLRAINQTQDLGLDGAQDFLVAINNGPTPVEPVPFTPAIDAGIVNTDGASVGPFLVPADPHGGTFDANDPATFAGGPVTVNGVSYIGLPFAHDPANPTVPLDIFQPITGSPFTPPLEIAPANFFRIELLDPPGGFQLNPGNLANPQAVQIDDFLVIGKVFNDGPNLAPAALDDIAATAAGRDAIIDVVANDLDPVVVGSNEQGIDPQAIAVADPLTDGPVLNLKGMPVLTATQPTAAGGSVRRVISIPIGKASFLYTPPPAVDGVPFTGADSFEYLIQDAGGLLSAPATVNITVEDLRIERADYRAKTGKWHLRGTSTDATDNLVTLTAGPRAHLTGAAEVPPVIGTGAGGNASLRVSDSAIELLLNVAPLPATAISAIHLHAGAAGTDGPVIFTLFDSAFGATFASPLSATLDAFDLQPRPEAGIANFADAVTAIRNGNAYLNVHTTAFADGEIRGQLLRQNIGTARVQADGTWEFRGHAAVSPGALPGVIIESSNGVSGLAPLRLR